MLRLTCWARVRSVLSLYFGIGPRT